MALAWALRAVPHLRSFVVWWMGTPSNWIQLDSIGFNNYVSDTCRSVGHTLHPVPIGLGLFAVGLIQLGAIDVPLPSTRTSRLPVPIPSP